MTTLIHGDDTAKSREYYLEERGKHVQKVVLDGATLTLTNFIQTTSGSGLFGDQQAIFIEELLSKKKSSKELDALIQEILQAQAIIFLWESKELSAAQLRPFNSATVKLFKIPKTVFAFLDALSPNAGEKAIALFHQLLQEENVNFALFMLQRQIRILLALHDTHQSSISEARRLAPWQKGKLEKQSKSFALDKLLQLHEQLYRLELGQKTGTLSLPLDQAIDFLLLSI